GAIVHIVTRRGGPPSASISFEGGGGGTTNLVASTSGTRGSLAWGGAIERMASDGDTRPFASIGGAVADDDDTRPAATMTLEWSPRRDQRVSVQYRRSDYERGSPGPYGSDPFGLYGGLDLISRGFGTSDSVAIAGDASAAGIRHRVSASFAELETEF